MKVHYTGRKTEISEAEKAKAKRRFEKIHRILGSNKDHEAHVILSQERNRCEAEVTLRALHHTLVCTGQNAHPFAALTIALEQLEQQAVKNKHKLTDSKKVQRQRGETPVAVELATPPPPADGVTPEPPEPAGPRIIRGNGAHPKPLTIEEAALQLDEQDRDQVTYRDAETDRICVLLRRRDGDLELVEA